MDENYTFNGDKFYLEVSKPVAISGEYVTAFGEELVIRTDGSASYDVDSSASLTVTDGMLQPGIYQFNAREEISMFAFSSDID